MFEDCVVVGLVVGEGEVEEEGDEEEGRKGKAGFEEEREEVPGFEGGEEEGFPCLVERFSN